MAGPLTSALLLVVLLFSLYACAQAGSETDAGLRVRSIGVLDRYAPFEALPGSSNDKTVKVFAARNEYEGFQFVITAGEAGARNVKVKISALRNAAGDTLPEARIFRERYVQVTQPTPESPYEAQPWPDILLPANNPAADKIALGYRAFPQDLSSDENLPVWVDLYAPEDVAAGEYKGTVTVTSEGESPVELPVSLTVWDFSLPRRPSLRTNFGLGSYRIADIYGFERTGYSARDNRLIRTYYDFLLDHHLASADFWDATPAPDVWGKPDFQKSFAGLGTVDENMRHYMQEKHASTYTLIFADTFPFSMPFTKDRGKAQEFLRDYAQWCASYLGGRGCYTSPALVDEPDTSEAYQQVRRWGAYFDEIHLPAGEWINFMVTEPPLETQPDKGDLRGSVDVWVPKFYGLWLDVEHAGKNISRQRLEKGEELWAYTAMNLPIAFRDYQKLNPRADMLKGSYPPIWQIDFPGINYRLPTWLFHHYGVTGMHYYDAMAWFDGANVWNDAASFRPEDSTEVWNGAGLLIYPGYQERIGFDGPVASLRLKWIRESVEDYMYLDLLEQVGEGEFVQRQVGRFARDFGNWSNDPATLMSVRQALGERLQVLHTGRSHLQETQK